MLKVEAWETVGALARLVDAMQAVVCRAAGSAGVHRVDDRAQLADSSAVYAGVGGWVEVAAWRTAGAAGCGI